MVHWCVHMFFSVSVCRAEAVRHRHAPRLFRARGISVRKSKSFSLFLSFPKDPALRLRWPSTEWETGPAQKSGENGKENGKWPLAWNGRKMATEMGKMEKKLGRGSGGVKSTGVSQSVRETSRDESQCVPSPEKLLQNKGFGAPIFEGSLPRSSPHSAGYARTSVHPYFPVAKKNGQNPIFGASFPFGGHFSAISGRGHFPFSFPFSLDSCAGPVSHSVDGHRRRKGLPQPY